MGTDGYPPDAWRLENFANAYRNWLVETVDGDDYRILFDVLYDVEFVWTIPDDAHRASSGRYLRERFESVSGMECDPEWVEWPCSLLEMLVALAMSMEGVLYDPDDASTTTEACFWEIIDNLGLSRFDDDFLLSAPQGAYDMIEDICDTALGREYMPNGRGGFFPLAHPRQDQRSVSIWHQMQDYILEKMGFESQNAYVTFSGKSGQKVT